MSDLRIIHGRGNIVDLLQEMLDRAKEGEVDVVALAVCISDGTYYTAAAAARGTPHAFLRAVGSIAHLNADLMSGNLGMNDA